MAIVNIMKRQLKIISFNANGIKKQKLELISLLTELSIDIVCINETHLDEKDRFQIPNYYTYRTDRPTRGGGTAVVIKRSIAHRQINIPPLQDIEATAVIIPTDQQEILIAALYHPPYQIFNITDLKILTSIHPQFILLGDLNAKHQNWNSRLNSPKGILLNDFATEHNINILGPDTPTHFPWNENHHPDVLDICIMKAKVVITEFSTFNALDSDHLPILIHISSTFIKTPIRTHKIAITDWEAINQELHQTIPGNPPIHSKEDIESAIQLITTTISTTYQNNTTLKDPQNKLLVPPHFSYLIKAKRRFRKIWQTTRDPQAKRALNRIQNAIRKQATKHTIEHFESILKQIPEDSPDIWKITKRLTSNPRSPSSAIQKINGQIEYTPDGKAEALADEFENRFKPHEELSHAEHEEHVKSVNYRFLQSVPTHIIPFTTPAEVKTIIRKLPNNKSPGFDRITPLQIKKLPKPAITYLTKIFNLCFRFQYFPKYWKRAIIVPLAKTRTSSILPQNYRPISLLNFLGKILEKIIMNRLQQYLTDPQRIHHEQFGFKAQHNTILPLYRLHFHITEAFKEKKHTVTTFLDISQAYDTIWIEGLIYKLIQLEFPDSYIHILHSFLTQRTFQVRYDGYLSTIRTSTAGVPQGAILSPTLYSLYVQDFKPLSGTLISLYADDTVLYTTDKNIDQAISRLQLTLNKFATWTHQWKIKLNVNKTQYVTFTKRRPRTGKQLYIQGKTIPPSPAGKYLGINMDTRLNYNQHIKCTAAIAAQRINKLYPVFTGPLPLRTKRTLYLTMIRPLLLYGMEVWSSTHERHLGPIRRIQRQVTRLITGADYLTSNTFLNDVLDIPDITNFINMRRQQFLKKLQHHPNPLIREISP
mgnify:CR=1 FL=1